MFYQRRGAGRKPVLLPGATCGVFKALLLLKMSTRIVLYFYLMGSPKYWLAIPTVAPVMQITVDTL